MYKIKHFENGLLEFNSDSELIEFVEKIFLENEDESDLTIPIPQTVDEALDYIATYCDNFEIL
jgi:hypothetical protein